MTEGGSEGCRAEAPTRALSAAGGYPRKGTTSEGADTTCHRNPEREDVAGSRRRWEPSTLGRGDGASLLGVHRAQRWRVGRSSLPPGPCLQQEHEQDTKGQPEKQCRHDCDIRPDHRPLASGMAGRLSCALLNHGHAVNPDPEQNSRNSAMLGIMKPPGEQPRTQ